MPAIPTSSRSSTIRCARRARELRIPCFAGPTPSRPRFTPATTPPASRGSRAAMVYAGGAGRRRRAVQRAPRMPVDLAPPAPPAIPTQGSGRSKTRVKTKFRLDKKYEPIKVLGHGESATSPPPCASLRRPRPAWLPSPTRVRSRARAGAYGVVISALNKDTGGKVRPCADSRPLADAPGDAYPTPQAGRHQEDDAHLGDADRRRARAARGSTHEVRCHAMPL